MTSKKHVLDRVKDEYNRWEALLGTLDEMQIVTTHLPQSEWTIKDLMAHLGVHQRRSIARLEAGLKHVEPVFPGWPAGLNPDNSDEDLQKINAWIFSTNRDRTWNAVYQDWRNGFLRFLELGEAVSEDDLLTAGIFPWMDGEPLSLVLTSSYEHHHEHYEILWAALHTEEKTNARQQI